MDLAERTRSANLYFGLVPFSLYGLVPLIGPWGLFFYLDIPPGAYFSIFFPDFNCVEEFYPQFLFSF